jgi:sigma-B regulation protein RsbU (phosphoserine phosphatase)
MKLRSKFFLILMVFSLVPLGSVAIIGHRTMRHVGAAMSADIHQNLSQIASGALAVSAESSAAMLARSRQAVEWALRSLASEAEAVLAGEPPARAQVYLASDFDDPATAPPDFGPRSGYLKKTAEGGTEEHLVSFRHPTFMVAPGTSAADVAKDIDRLSLLTEAFAGISSKMAPSLHWLYVSLENGVHVSFPGHGGYPAGYDPRQRPWYVNAADAVRWTLPLVDATTGQVILTASKQVRHPDGSRAGVVAMDLLLTEVLRIEALSSLWTTAMRSLLVVPVRQPEDESTGLLIVAQKDYQTQASSWEQAIAPERLTSGDPIRMAQLTEALRAGRSGYVEMPFKGLDSTWAFAALDGQSGFIIIVPKSVLDRLPQRTIQILSQYTQEELLITAAAAGGAVLLATLAAFLGSRGFTRPMYELVDATGRLGRGDFSVRLRPHTGDERDRVIQAFNAMVPKLEDHLRMHESLQLATEVQQNLLPQAAPSLPGLDIAGLSSYCDETGGDYYDYLEIPQDPFSATAVVVGDVSGHGVHAALLMASARAALRLRASLPGGPAEIIADVNRRFTSDVGCSGAFMTLFYLAIDRPCKTIRWVRAGHDPAICYDPVSERFEEFGGQGVPLGVDETAAFEESEKKELRPGEIIFIGTDGIWETTAPDGRLFGKKNLSDLIRTFSGRSAGEITQEVLKALEAFRQGRKPSDDITMVVIKIL